MPLDAEAWAHVRAVYEANEIAIPAICEAFGVSKAQLYARKRAERWRGRGSAVQRVGRTSGKAPSAGPGSRQNAHGKLGQREARALRARLIERLYSAIDKKLTQMETALQHAIDSNAVVIPADHERETCAIGGLVRAIEQTSELNADRDRSSRHAAGRSSGVASDASGAAGGTGHGAATHDPAGAERQRRELAQRIERLLAQRNARGGSE